MTAPREITAAEIVFHASPREPIEDCTRIHVWLIDVDDASKWDATDERIVSRASVLSRDEEARADRLRNPRQRDRWRRGQTVLRHILGTNLGCPPQDVCFAHNVHGKPFVLFPVQGERFPQRLDFNVSHSENLLFVGVAFGANIGVDIEMMTSDNDGTALAEAHFSSTEKTQLAALSPDDRQLAFFRCWTLKEAVLKAQGVGISAGLDAIELSLDASGTPRIMNSRIDAVGLESAVYQQKVTSGGDTAAVAICTLRGTIPGF